MPFKPAALLASLGTALAVSSAQASEGLIAMAALTCEPVRVTRSVVEGCLAAEPALRARYATLVSDWMARNARDAAALEGQCRAELESHAPDAQERNERWAHVRRANDDTIRKSLATGPASKGDCDAMLQEISNGKGDLARFLKKP